jgi:hypothetical protein
MKAARVHWSMYIHTQTFFGKATTKNMYNLTSLTNVHFNLLDMDYVNVYFLFWVLWLVSIPLFSYMFVSCVHIPNAFGFRCIHFWETCIFLQRTQWHCILSFRYIHEAIIKKSPPLCAKGRTQLLHFESVQHCATVSTMCYYYVRCLYPGWPDEFDKKIAQNEAQPIFFQINTWLFQRGMS